MAHTKSEECGHIGFFELSFTSVKSVGCQRLLALLCLYLVFTL